MTVHPLGWLTLPLLAAPVLYWLFRDEQFLRHSDRWWFHWVMGLAWMVTVAGFSACLFSTLERSEKRRPAGQQSADNNAGERGQHAKDSKVAARLDLPVDEAALPLEGGEVKLGCACCVTGVPVR